MTAATRTLYILAAIGASVFAAASSSFRGSKSAVTPVETVINLLKNLEAQIEDEGKAEATQYDKYACFCKEQADEKTYAIEKSEKKEASLAAQISALDAELNELNADVKKLGADMATLSSKIADATDARTKESSVYAGGNANTSAAIGALKSAIDAMKASKADMSGAKLDFVQVRSLASRALVVQHGEDGAGSQVAELLTKLMQEPPSYAYRSNDIVVTLQNLHAAFLQNKKDADTEEFHAQAAFDKNVLNMKNEHSFKEKSKDEMEKTQGVKEGEKGIATADLLAETKAKTSDSEFLRVVTADCEAKADQWNQRSTSRSEELNAIAGALTALSEGVAPSYSANEKLVDLQMHKNGRQSTSAMFVKRSASFLQIRGDTHQSTQSASAQQRAVRLLTEAGRSLGSVALTTVAMRMRESDDHFVKVRQIIKDLMAKLKADADSEATHKSFCDKAMAENVGNRDKAKAESENLQARSSQLEAENAQLMKEIAGLSRDIANSEKTLKEAGLLRATEKEENERSLATAREGKDAVNLALKILSEYYLSQGSALLEVKSSYVPPESDREGKTVGDRAPEIWEGQYNGKQADSKGVTGLLQVILSDFERTIATVTEDEKSAEEEFVTLGVDTRKEIADKMASMKAKEDRTTAIESESMDTADSLKDEHDLLQVSGSALDELKKDCVDEEESYEERVTRRQKEIDALKEAQLILEGWQS